MCVSDLTNGCKKATDPTLILSTAALIQTQIALDAHVSDLEEREKQEPGQWTQELVAARQALRIVRRA